MYAFLEEMFKGEYCCSRWELVVSLEAPLLHLENQVEKHQQPGKVLRHYPAGAGSGQYKGR